MMPRPQRCVRLIGIAAAAFVALGLPACQGPQPATPAATGIAGADAFRYRVLKPLLKDPMPPRRPFYLKNYAGYNYGPDRPRKRDLARMRQGQGVSSPETIETETSFEP